MLLARHDSSRPIASNRPSKEVFLDRDTKTPVLPPRCEAGRAAGQLTITSGALLTSLSGVSMHNRPYRSSSSGAAHDRRIL